MPLIASLNGITREGWTGIATDLKAAGAAAIELDLFHLPIDPREGSVEVEHRLIETVRGVVAVVDIPVAVKLSPYFTAPAHLAAALADAGARGIVLFNRCLSRHRLRDADFCPQPGFVHGGGNPSAADVDRDTGRKNIAEPCGPRGVEGPEERDQIPACGADEVLTASALLRHGAGYLGRLVRG